MARASRHRHPQSPLPYFLLTNPAGPEAEYLMVHNGPSDISLFVSAIEAISGSSEYQLNQNGSVDISRRELSAPAGARYLRKPDDDERRSHGAVGPRAFVMPLDVDQMNLGPRFSARTRFKLPHLDSNQDKGFQRPVCCHYTMGERQKHMFSAKCSLCHILRTPHTTGCRVASLRTSWRIPMRDGSAANGIETIFKKFFCRELALYSVKIS